MIDSIEAINDIEVLFEKKVVLYGAGKEGKKTYSELKKAGIPVAYFCDGNFESWGKHVANEVEIISPGQLRRLDAREDIAIIISIKKTKFMSEIAETLLDMRLRTLHILTAFGLQICLAQNIHNPKINEKYRESYLHIFTLQVQLEWLRRSTRFAGKIISLLSQSNLVLIYQPGKVGSRTIYASLGKVGIPKTHTHSMIAFLNKRLSRPDRFFALSKMPNEFKQIHDESLAKACSLIKSQDKIRIITLVREPVSQELSLSFQNLDEFFPCVMNLGDSVERSCLEFMTKIGTLDSTYGWQFDWFDLEIKSVFGVDVFAHPFDKEAGYSVIKQDNVEVLIMKLEKLNTLENVIGEFVGAPNFKLVNSNESEQKGYKYFYKSFRETIKLPRSMFDFYYKGNPRVDHFYTEEEKTSFIKKWEKNIED